MSKKLSVNTLYLLFRSREKSRVTTHRSAWFFGGFVWVVWYLWAPSSPLESVLISEVEEVWDQQPQTSLGKSRVRLCKWRSLDTILEFSLRGVYDRSVDWQLSLPHRTDRTIFPAITAFSFSFFPLPAAPQVVYFTEMYNIFSELTDQIDQAGLTDEQRERETEAKLSELRALSIVADDWGRKAENREGLLSLPLWMDCTLFTGSSAQFRRTAVALTWLSVCFLAASSPPCSSCTTLPMFHSLYKNSVQLKRHINKAISQVQRYKPICFFFFLSKGIKQLSSELINRVSLLGFRDVYKHLFLK